MTLQQQQKIAIRSKLLQCLQSESLPHVRNKVGDAVAEIARQYSDDGRPLRLAQNDITGTKLVNCRRTLARVVGCSVPGQSIA